jgi:hypothetical protein
LQGNCKATMEQLQSDSKAIAKIFFRGRRAIAERSQTDSKCDCKPILERLQSNSKATAERLKSDSEAKAKRS